VRELKVLLIVESGFLFDVCLAQDLSSMYLMDMAEAGTIAMAVPEYSLVEIDGRAADKIQGRKKGLNSAIELTSELARSEYNKEYALAAKDNLKKLLELADAELIHVKEAINDIRELCILITHNSDVYVKGKLRYLSSQPPFKEADCQIYESILKFVKEKKREYDKTIYLTKDMKDFDHTEIHEELSDLGVKIMFSSGECVREVLKQLQG